MHVEGAKQGICHLTVQSLKTRASSMSHGSLKPTVHPVPLVDCVCICVCVFVCEMEENFLSIEAGSLRTVGNRVKNTFGEFPLWLSKLQT